MASDAFGSEITGRTNALDIADNASSVIFEVRTEQD